MRITARTVLTLVANHYEVSYAEITGPSRLRRISLPRQVAMFLVWRHCSHLSKPQIGKAMSRDHTSVFHGIQKIEEGIAMSADLARDVAFLSRRLGAMRDFNPEWKTRIIIAERELTKLYRDASRVAVEIEYDQAA